MKVNSCINQANGQNLLGKSFLAYSLYSWGVAGIIVTIGQLLDEYKKSLPDYIIRPGFGENYCWFSGFWNICITSINERINHNFQIL